MSDRDTFKMDGFQLGLLKIDNKAFDKVHWPPHDKELMDATALKEIANIKTQLEKIFTERYDTAYCNFYGVWRGYVEGVRGNVIVYLDKSPHTTDNYIEITALDRCKIFPEEGEYLWFNDNIKFQKRFNNDDNNNIRFIYFDYKLGKDKKLDFLEEAEKEKQELAESYEESVRQAKERGLNREHNDDTD